MPSIQITNYKLQVYNLIPSLPYIRTRFEEYNRLYFEESLPLLPIRYANAKGYLGRVSFKRVLQPDGTRRNTDFALYINARIDLPEEVVEDTILHEMIHYYIGYHQLRDTSPHGKLFRANMERINRMGNRHICISTRLSKEQTRQITGVAKPHVVAVAHFADGRIGIKVVPRQANTILHFHRQALRSFPIDDIRWYYTEDEYFSRYPSSDKLRLYLITDCDGLRGALAKSRRITLSANGIRLEPNLGSNLLW